MNNLAIQEYFELALVFIQCVYHYIQQQQQQQQLELELEQQKKKDEDEQDSERTIAINSILDSISNRLFSMHFQSTIYQRIPLFVIYTVENNEGLPYDGTRLSPIISANSLTSTVTSTLSTASLPSRITSDEPPPVPTLPRLLLPSSPSTSDLALSDPLPLPLPLASASASVSPMLTPSPTSAPSSSPSPSSPPLPPPLPMQFPLPLPSPTPVQLQLPVITSPPPLLSPPPPLVMATGSSQPLRNEIIPLHNIDQSSSSDTESVAGVKELKELIKGREVLTFGPDGYGQSINDDILPQMTLSTPLSTSFPGLTKLLDTEGNEYLLHLNGFVTPIIKNPDLNGMEISSIIANYNNNNNSNNHNNSHNGYYYNNRSMVLPTNAAGLSTTIPPSTTTAITNNTNNSSSIMANANGAMNTSLSLINNNDNRKRRRLNQSPYRNLTTRNSRAPNNDRLKEFQTQILELTQFYGDLDLGTNNRFGAVDSTTIIIGTISRSNSSKSSFRSSSLRTSLCKDDSSQSSNSPASFNVHKNR